jgi:hypothetical protein
VWVQKEQIVRVTHPLQCAVGGSSKVSTGDGQFVCVREGVAEALRKLDSAK